MKSAVFSGRFDPPHAGHFMTIQRIMSMYAFVLVPILDYKGRTGCTAREAKIIFENHFNMIVPPFLRNRVRFVINKTHFGEISERNYRKLLNDNGLYAHETIYLSGNKAVLRHFENLTVVAKFLPRHNLPQLDQFVFEGTEIRGEMRRKKQRIDEFYHIST